MTKWYVRFYFPGFIFSNSEDKEIPSANARFDIPENSYGWQTYSKTVVELDGEELIGKPSDLSPMTYLGEILTLEDVKKLEPRKDYEILIWNMEINKYDKVVRVRTGNFFQLQKDDVVIYYPHNNH